MAISDTSYRGSEVSTYWITSSSDKGVAGKSCFMMISASGFVCASFSIALYPAKSENTSGKSEVNTGSYLHVREGKRVPNS
jgi:hypothetical protein